MSDDSNANSESADKLRERPLPIDSLDKDRTAAGNKENDTGKEDSEILTPLTPMTPITIKAAMAKDIKSEV